MLSLWEPAGCRAYAGLMEEPEVGAGRIDWRSPKALLGAATAVTSLALAIWPPNGPAWPYLLYSLAAVLWLALLMSMGRSLVSERFEQLGTGARRVIGGLIAFVAVGVLVLWVAFLPDESYVLVARGFLALPSVDAKPTEAQVPPQPSSREPDIFMSSPEPVAAPEPPRAATSAVRTVAPVDPETERLRRQVAELESKLAEATRAAAPRPDSVPAPEASSTSTPPPAASAPETTSPKVDVPQPARQIPQIPPVVPTADPLVTLSAYLVQGQNLRALYVRERGADEVEAQVNGWYRASLAYVNQVMGVDYAARYRSYRPSGMAIHAFPVAKMGMVDAIDGRLQNLVTFLTELRARR